MLALLPISLGSRGAGFQVWVLRPPRRSQYLGRSYIPSSGAWLKPGVRGCDVRPLGRRFRFLGAWPRLPWPLKGSRGPSVGLPGHGDAERTCVTHACSRDAPICPFAGCSSSSSHHDPIPNLCQPPAQLSHLGRWKRPQRAAVWRKSDFAFQKREVTNCSFPWLLCLLGVVQRVWNEALI